MKIIKSIRKTLSMKIDESGELIIKAPFFVSNKRIDDFIEKNKIWIEEKKQIILSRTKKYIQGEKFMYLGEEYELNLHGESKKIVFDGFNFYLDKVYIKDASKMFVEFYKEEAKSYIENRINFLSEKCDLKFNKLRITSAKTRWGSCSSSRNISFSYRLIMAPLKTIDYVIIHELAHLKEMNHSRNFWLLVQEFMKIICESDHRIYTNGLCHCNYKIHMNWLKKHGNKLIF